jgi:hypothetical protein
MQQQIIFIRLHYSLPVTCLFCLLPVGLLLNQSTNQPINQSTNHSLKTCFICGLTRSEYDKLGLTAWGSHCSREHNPFTYVAFVAYLNRKPESSFTGVESHTMNQIKAGRQWIPNRTSFAIEQAAVASSSANAANVERQLASDKIPHGPSSSAQRHGERVAV